MGIMEATPNEFLRKDFRLDFTPKPNSFVKSRQRLGFSVPRFYLPPRSGEELFGLNGEKNTFHCFFDLALA